MKYIGYFLGFLGLAGLIYGCITKEDILPSATAGTQTEVLNFVVKDNQAYVFSRNNLQQYNVSDDTPVLVDQFEASGYIDYGYFQNDQLIAGNLEHAWIYDLADNGNLGRDRQVDLDQCDYAKNRVFNSNFDVIEFWEEFVLVGRLSRSTDLIRTRCGADSLFLFRYGTENLNSYLDAISLTARDIISRGDGKFLVLSRNAILEMFIRADRLRLGDTLAYTGGQHFFEKDEQLMVVSGTQLLVYNRDSLEQEAPLWSYEL